MRVEGTLSLLRLRFGHHPLGLWGAMLCPVGVRLFLRRIACFCLPGAAEVYDFSHCEHLFTARDAIARILDEVN
jgi:hypothetical protein